MFPRILGGDDDAQRALGIAAGHSWIPAADSLVVYDDHGYSPGMQAGVSAAHAAGIPVEFRTLEEDD